MYVKIGDMFCKEYSSSNFGKAGVVEGAVCRVLIKEYEPSSGDIWFLVKTPKPLSYKVAASSEDETIERLYVSPEFDSFDRKDIVWVSEEMCSVVDLKSNMGAADLLSKNKEEVL